MGKLFNALNPLGKYNLPRMKEIRQGFFSKIDPELITDRFFRLIHYINGQSIGISFI